MKDVMKMAMDNVKTEKDIAAAARERAERPAAKRRIRPVIAAVCAAAVMCTTAVSAARMGWLEDMFGVSSELIGEHLGKVEVAASDVSFEKNELAPADMDVKVLDMVSDGEILIINYDMTGVPEDMEIILGCIYDPAERTRGYMSWAYDMTMLSDGTYAASMQCSEGINSGDAVEMYFHNSDYETIGTMNIKIDTDVPKLYRDIEVGKNAVCRDRSRAYTMEKEIYVESIRFSALTMRINYLTGDNSNNFIINSDVTVYTADGTQHRPKTFCLYDTATDLPKDENGKYKQHIDIQLDGLIDINEITAVNIGSITVPIR